MMKKSEVEVEVEMKVEVTHESRLHELPLISSTNPITAIKALFKFLWRPSLSEVPYLCCKYFQVIMRINLRRVI